MKVAVVSDDRITIAAHFGRAQGFVVYTIDNNSVTAKDWLSNTFTAHAQGHPHGEHEEPGHGMHGHGPILKALTDCDAVISGGMGRRAYDDLVQSGHRVLITDEGNVEKALSLFLAGQLVDQPQLACGHGHGHQGGCH
jgi:predicted Fe-Mo cluster-binding NifX family protein